MIPIRGLMAEVEALVGRSQTFRAGSARRSAEVIWMMTPIPITRDPKSLSSTRMRGKDLFMKAIWASAFCWAQMWAKTSLACADVQGTYWRPRTAALVLDVGTGKAPSSAVASGIDGSALGYQSSRQHKESSQMAAARRATLFGHAGCARSR